MHIEINYLNKSPNCLHITAKLFYTELRIDMFIY